jgi:fumarate reductase subunit D
MRPVTRKASAVFLLMLLALFVALASLPHGVAQIRFGPLSLLWWYGGVIAPALAVVAALGRGTRE